LDSAHLRIDRRLARQDTTSYLLLLLDTSGRRRRDDGGPVSDDPRLVAKDTGEVIRLTVHDALARQGG
jgi:hypothetical protein